MKKFLALLLALVAVVSLCACGQTEAEEPETTAATEAPAETPEDTTEAPAETEPAETTPPIASDEEAMKIVDQILSAPEMTLDEAYTLAFSIQSNCEEHLALQKELTEMKACQGEFFQHSDTSSRTYKADVTFYLKDGEYWFAIDYAGYTGTLKDGQVEENVEDDFLYDAETTGTHTNLFTGERMTMDFYIQFGKERMYITWGTSEYYLERT